MSPDAGLEQVDVVEDGHLDDLLELFKHEWWTKDRQLDEVLVLLEEADVVVGYRDAGTGRLVAFARVRRRDASRALVMDVVVAREHRERGVGGDLLDDVVGHRALRAVRRSSAVVIDKYRCFTIS